jgi:hypothetical protein
MKKQEIIDILTYHYLADKYFTLSKEYSAAFTKIKIIISGNKKATLLPEIDRIIALGLEAVLILTELLESGDNAIKDLLELEEYEICAQLRDINQLIINNLYYVT